MIYNEFKGMKLSRLGFGCMRFIMDKESGKVDQDKVNAMFGTDISCGLRFEEKEVESDAIVDPELD